jgi:hypothetical protein
MSTQVYPAVGNQKSPEENYYGKPFFFNRKLVNIATPKTLAACEDTKPYRPPPFLPTV